MTAVDLHDLITLREEGAKVSVYCPALPRLPQEHNLAYRAADEYLSQIASKAGIRVRIDKGIPVGGGMGGGSSDAAAVLLALDNVLNNSEPGSLASSLREARLVSIARSLGADVPFFLGPDRVPPAWIAALCTGIGDLVTPVEAGSFWLVALFLAQGVSTPWAFSAWDADNPGTDRQSFAESDSRLYAVLNELSSGNAESLAKVVYNDLEEPVVRRRRDIAEARAALLEGGALNAVLTGSGSTVYGICRSRTHGEAVREKVTSLKLGFLKDARVVRTGVV